MLDSLFGWINTVVVTIIFAAFVEMLIPSNNMKKYIRLVMGLLIMAVILEPILSYLKKDYSLSGYSFKYENLMDSSLIKEASKSYSQKQQDSVTKLYKQNLEAKMKDGIGKLVPGKDVSVSVDIVEDSKAQNFGEIKKLTVTLKDIIKDVDKVGKIKIGGENKKASQNASENYTEIKKSISALYDIDPSKIEIKNASQK